ncbi:peptidase S10, serine carboxypeptidase [Neocallimastix californiae]|jgi:cathepsin A (carboxypeptidase C)|uniref:Carboxypeptidase n=1 Tax=Neocallimastix californiae TaxID=1754190 RepID=A0A1Y2BE35_9FUNG|nr:peptidase S10, serine carboxypeptidase [Neocallimastix californiae]|eukprot:ORY32966.1 peptidase S10, serine carboxypeptidase [Neocallimastix californiae]
MKFLNTTFLFTTIGLIITNVLGYHFNQQILLQDPVDNALTFKEKSNPLDWAIVTHAAFPSIQLRYREPDLCETTEGVNQYAGYLDIDDEDKHFFFWFFESRSNPETDPTILWLNGGPGCSSLTGLLMELGPCRVAPSGNETIYNEHSWNNKANLLFLDQPVNVGYSYSDSNNIKDTISAGKDVYAFLQLFFKKFPQFNRKVHVFGESYAGHYIPAIGNEIITHNKELEDVKIKSDFTVQEQKSLVKIDLDSLGIGNGLVDPFVQYRYYTEMACSSDYGQLVSEEECLNMHKKEGTCVRLIGSCYQWENPFVCVPSSVYCNNALISPFQKTGRNVYDVRTNCEDGDLCYSIMDDINTYLNRDDVKEILGVDASMEYKSCNMQINLDFLTAGDWMLPYVNFLPDILESGTRVLVYAGDADFICNWIGNKAWTMELDWEGKLEFNFALDKEWYGYQKEKEGDSYGQLRSFMNFSFLRVYQAGHMVPYDQPKASEDMINAWISGELGEEKQLNDN